MWEDKRLNLLLFSFWLDILFIQCPAEFQVLFEWVIFVEYSHDTSDNGIYEGQNLFGKNYEVELK